MALSKVYSIRHDVLAASAVPKGSLDAMLNYLVMHCAVMEK
jgi:hypothetical protein